MIKTNLFLSCEHGGNLVPDEYRELFANAHEVLDSHRGWDAGALTMATLISDKLGVPLFSQTVTRLLIEMNRSLDSYQLFSQFTESLSAEKKDLLKEQFYFPYRRSVENYLTGLISPVVHLSIHSFTPVMNGVKRTVDIGLLFDPSRRAEVSFCERLLVDLKKQLPEYEILFNEPYLGIDDGFTTYLRTLYADDHYTGIEIEVNQRHVNTPQWRVFGEAISNAVQGS
jgi:predicted N-formylglutamate amidohydrolase